MAIVVLLDVPMVLYGFMWYQGTSLLDPDRFSPLTSWADIMSAGGRFVLTIAAVTLGISVASILSGKRSLANLSPAFG
jgi:hypothetical protein